MANAAETQTESGIEAEGTEGPAESGGGDELSALKAEKERLEDEMLRLKASQANQIKRLQGDIVRARMRGVEQVAAGLIDVADNLERALADETGELEPLRKGVEMTLGQLQQLLVSNGVERIEPAPGEKFDPELHMAAKQEESSEHGPNRITSVLACGYQQNGRILRPAAVVVSAAPAGQH